MTSLFDPVLFYALTVLKRFLLLAGFGALLVSRFSGNPDDTMAAVICLTVALVLVVFGRKR